MTISNNYRNNYQTGKPNTIKDNNSGERDWLIK